MKEKVFYPIPVLFCLGILGFIAKTLLGNLEFTAGCQTEPFPAHRYEEILAPIGNSTANSTYSRVLVQREKSDSAPYQNLNYKLSEIIMIKDLVKTDDRAFIVAEILWNIMKTRKTQNQVAHYLKNNGINLCNTKRQIFRCCHHKDVSRIYGASSKYRFAHSVPSCQSERKEENSCNKCNFATLVVEKRLECRIHVLYNIIARTQEKRVDLSLLEATTVNIFKIMIDKDYAEQKLLYKIDYRSKNKEEEATGRPKSNLDTQALENSAERRICASDDCVQGRLNTCCYQCRNMVINLSKMQMKNYVGINSIKRHMKIILRKTIIVKERYNKKCEEGMNVGSRKIREENTTQKIEGNHSMDIENIIAVMIAQLSVVTMKGIVLIKMSEEMGQRPMKTAHMQIQKIVERLDLKFGDIKKCEERKNRKEKLTIILVIAIISVVVMKVIVLIKMSGEMGQRPMKTIRMQIQKIDERLDLKFGDIKKCKERKNRKEKLTIFLTNRENRMMLKEDLWLHRIEALGWSSKKIMQTKER